MTNGAKLTRVLLKLSGEVLSGGPTGLSIEPETVKAISEELAEVQALLHRGERLRVTKNVVRVLLSALLLRHGLLPLPLPLPLPALLDVA